MEFTEMIEYQRIVENWLNDPSLFENVNNRSLDSRHLDELVENVSPDDQFNVAVKLFEQLIAQYQHYSSEMMAMLVLSLNETDNFEQHALDEVISGKIKLHPSTELYLVKRELNLEPYVVEEYKRPIHQSLFKCQNGVIYSYYRLMRNSAHEPYSPGFYFEHYPKGAVGEDWL